MGFVPTMGALHEGHCLLVSQSLQENDKTIVSIFVNPSQFAPHEDLEDYPRTLDSDLEILCKKFVQKKVDAVFVPKVSEMYPAGITQDVSKQKGAFVNVLGCSEQLEGETRPHFFRGVATVVTKLLNIVGPTRVYFGQKDAQQCVVIRSLVRDLLIDTEVRVLPTVREKSMLALSSRNAYLSEDVRQESSLIYQSLRKGELFYLNHRQNGKVSTKEILEQVKSTLVRPDFEIDYVSVNHPDNLDELEYVEPGVGAILSTAVRVPKRQDGQARLIDNIILH